MNRIPAIFCVVAVLHVGAGCGREGSAPSQEPSEQPPESNRIAFLGDGLTQGHGVDPDQAFPTLIEKKIRERGWPFEVSNAGIDNETSSEALHRFDWVIRRGAAVLVIAEGANDGPRGIPVDVTQQNLQAIINQARKQDKNMRFVLAAVKPRPTDKTDYRVVFESMFPVLAEQNDSALIPNLLEGIEGNPELLLPNGYHPNAKGHRVIAETVWSALEPILEELAPLMAAAPSVEPASP